MSDQFAFDFSTPLPELPQLWTPDDIYQAADEFRFFVHGHPNVA